MLKERADRPEDEVSSRVCPVRCPLNWLHARSDGLLKELLVRRGLNRNGCEDDQHTRPPTHAGPSESEEQSPVDTSLVALHITEAPENLRSQIFGSNKTHGADHARVMVEATSSPEALPSSEPPQQKNPSLPLNLRLDSSLLQPVNVPR